MATGLLSNSYSLSKSVFIGKTVHLAWDKTKYYRAMLLKKGSQKYICKVNYDFSKADKEANFSFCILLLVLNMYVQSGKKKLC